MSDQPLNISDSQSGKTLTVPQSPPPQIATSGMVGAMENATVSSAASPTVSLSAATQVLQAPSPLPSLTELQDIAENVSAVTAAAKGVSSMSAPIPATLQSPLPLTTSENL